MRVLSRIHGQDAQTVYDSRLIGLEIAGNTPQPASEMYRLLRAYYLNNGLYEYLARALYEAGIKKEALKSLRNPAYRVVEFYVAHLWPGMLPDGLPIEAKSDTVKDAIEQVWTWSNWSAQKQVAARTVACTGDLFIKAAQSGDRKRVFLQLIEPETVSDFGVDERGFLQFIRIDVPQTRRKGDKIERYIHTEVWDKETGLYRRWESDDGAKKTIEQLGEAQDTEELSAFGIDFVPFVHAKLRDVGEQRGVGAFTLQLDKIDEANRMATRLHQMLFRHNKPLWALRANAMDKTGRPMPPPRMDGAAAGETDYTVELGDERMVSLPGTSELDSLVPDLKYDAALAVVNAQMQELEADLPELAYYKLREFNQVSGRAVRLLLSDAVDKVVEARGNAETALARADAMALTLGANLGLFDGIGTYEAGDFEHTFREREVIQISWDEKLDTVGKAVGAGMPLATALRRVGWTKEDLAEMETDRAAESARQETELAQAYLEAQRRFDQGSQVGTDSGSRI